MAAPSDIYIIKGIYIYIYIYISTCKPEMQTYVWCVLDKGLKGTGINNHTKIAFG